MSEASEICIHILEIHGTFSVDSFFFADLVADVFRFAFFAGDFSETICAYVIILNGSLANAYA